MNMYGWDTIYAVNIDCANKALAQSISKLIPGVTQTISGQLGNYTVNVEFGSWQIALGGSGQLINLQIPLTQGSITSSNGHSIPLNNLTALFSVSLKLASTANHIQSLDFDFHQAGTVGQQPAKGIVVPMGFVGTQPDPSVAVLALNAIAEGLVANVSKILFAFAQINLVPPQTNSWLAPHNLNYAFFQNNNNEAYLAILSTTGDASALPVTIDPALTSGGHAGFAFSLPLFFNNCLIPSMASALSHASPSDFTLDNASPPNISNANGRSLALGEVKVAAITYYPSIDQFKAIPGANDIQLTLSGGCDVYAGLSMSWDTSVTNQFFFNSQNQTIGFNPANSPSVNHSVHIPWYWWALSPVIAGIADGVATLIGNSIADFIGGKVSSGLMSATVPTSVQFAGMNAFNVTGASFNGAVILIGNPD